MDMATARLSLFLRRLTRGMVAETLVDQSDRQLVEQFLARRDEAVFTALVRRHGPMVYRVCWRVLQQEQDAEDAFQATFLLLAQKLHTVRKQDSLSSWLHGVAHRVALKARAQATRRCRHEQQAGVSQPAPPDEVAWRESRTALDAELARLPDKWRLPLILCYLEGRTQDEAAGRLGWRRATLQRRLAEARAALGRRLSRRGVVWPAALSAVLLSESVAPAALTLGLVGSTVEAAASVAAGRAAISAVSVRVAALTEGVLKPMLLSKRKITTGVLLLVVAGLSGAAGLIYQTQAAERPPARRGTERTDGDQPTAKNDEKPLKKARDAVVADFKKLNEKEASITIASYTNAGPGNTETDLAAEGDLELTWPLAKGAKVFVVEVKDGKDRDLKDKVRKEIRLEDLAKHKPNKMWVYPNEEPDGSLGRIVMEIIVFDAKDK
jgi:RNA polymerase sigma factor (sigma-70 family)